MNFKDNKKKEQVKDVKYIDDATFKNLMRKIIRENAEALKRLSKK
jgi:hypothetical protein